MTWESKPLRYGGNCDSCGTKIEVRAVGWHDASIKKVRCAACGPLQEVAGTSDVVATAEPVTSVARSGEPVPDYQPGLDPSAGFGVGTPGGSAQREYERRREHEHQAAQQQRGVRLLFVVLAAVGGYLAVQVFAAIVNHIQPTNTTSPVHQIVPPSTAHGLGLMFAVVAAIGMTRTLWGRRQSTESWGSGARGERIVAARLATLGGRGVMTIHDRRIPGSKANIDHIAVGPSGVYVIDAKVTKGKVSAKTTGPIWNRGPVKLFFGGRDRSSALEGMSRQVDVVSKVLNNKFATNGASVQPMLVLVGAEWGWFARPLRVRGVWVGWPKAMSQSVGRAGQLSPEAIRRIAQILASELAEA
jgi:hypothetical protein